MSIASTTSSIHGQSILTQYQRASHADALKRLLTPGLGDSATFGSQAQLLSDLASGAKTSSTDSTGSASFLSRLPTDPKKLERLAQRMEAQVARLKKHGRIDQATQLSAFADAVRQRAKNLTSPPTGSGSV